ncbi:MAG: Ig-like domain-containing protein [Cyclobacteriaceae bacterium]
MKLLSGLMLIMLSSFTAWAQPNIVNRTPAHNAIDVNQAAIITISITYNTPVTLGSGNIIIRNLSDDVVVTMVDVTTGTVVAEDFSVDLAAGVLSAATSYYIEADPGIVITDDGLSTPSSAIIGSTNWRFETTVAPTINSLNPANTSGNFTITNNLVAQFSENIQAGSGNIELRLSSDNSLIQSFDVTSAVSIVGNTLTINPTDPLLYSTEYYVIIPATTIRDLAGNFFAGITSSSGWSFTTQNDTNPPVITSTTPADNATNLPASTATLTIQFNKDVFPVPGIVSGDNERIRIGIGFAEEAEIDKDDADVISISGNTVTILLNQIPFTFSNGATYNVRIGNNVFQDAFGNIFTGISSTTTWDFSIESAPNITGFSTSQTCVGDNITINGSGFGANPTVQINGVSATVVSPSPLVITVPGGLAVGTFPVSVTNTGNSLSTISGTNLTIKPAINIAATVTAQDAIVLQNGSTNVLVEPTQTGVNYLLRRLIPAPATNIGVAVAGNDDEIALPTGNLSSTGTYEFMVRVNSTGCTERFLTQTANVEVSSLSANAGNNRTICNGIQTTLGANPTVNGGTGFYNIQWSASPADPSLNASNNKSSNPIVSPTQTTVYTLQVNDGGGAFSSSSVTVNVNQPTPTDEIEITYDPEAPGNLYTTDSEPVLLGHLSDVTGTSVFSGNGISNNQFIPSSATVGSNNILMKFTNTQGCVTEIDFIITVIDTEVIFSNLEATYCSEDGNFVLHPVSYAFLTLQSVSMRDVATGVVNQGFSYNGTNGFLNTHVARGGSKLFTGTYRFLGLFDIVFTQEIHIYSNPVVDFSGINEVNGYCQSEDLVQLRGNWNGGTFAGGPWVTNFSGGEGRFDPAHSGLNAANPSANTISYTYTTDVTEGNCTSSITKTTPIHAVPTVDFEIEDGCIGLPVSFTPSVNANGSQIVSYNWNFGNNQIIESDRMDTINHAFEVTYQASGNFIPVLQVFTDRRCEATKDDLVQIGLIPDVDFSWSNVCDGQNAEFQLITNFNHSNIATIEWDFGDGFEISNSPPLNASLNEANTTGTLQNPEHDYTNYGNFDASLRIISNLGCTDIMEKPVYRVPHAGAITASDRYFESLNDSHGHWVAGGINSSWEHAYLHTSSAKYISSDSSENGMGGAWVTNANGHYNPDEKSWLHLPCVDVSNLPRPVISFDMRNLTADQFDGVVFQINSSNDTENESSWTTIGSSQGNDGINWYNRSGIAGNPGNQTLNQFGWSQIIDSLSWRTARFPLDTYIPANIADRENVRLRFAFGGQSSQASEDIEGFAVDNLLLGSRDHVVLMEYFTNVSNSMSTYNNFVENFLNPYSNEEIIKLQYHLGLPQVDPIYNTNIADASGRAFYYGITNPPAVLMDGYADHSPFQNWVQTKYNNSSLVPAGVEIVELNTRADDPAKLTIDLTINAKQDLSNTAVIHVALVEKNLDINAQTYTYVMRKMIPNAAGVKLHQGLALGTDTTLTYSWTPPGSLQLEDVGILAFIQDETTRQIYQSKFLDSPPHLPTDLVTSLEDIGDKSHVLVYPNPARDKFNIQLAPDSRNVKLRIYNSVGIHMVAQQSIDGSIVIDSSMWPSGLYHAEIEYPDKTRVNKRLVVVK